MNVVAGMTYPKRLHWSSDLKFKIESFRKCRRLKNFYKHLKNFLKSSLKILMKEKILIIIAIFKILIHQMQLRKILIFFFLFVLHI